MSDDQSMEMVPEALSVFGLEELQAPTSDSRIRVRRRQERTAKWKAKGRLARAVRWRSRQRSD